MKQDYFEMDRVIEDLAKSYAAPCATSWFKVSNIKKPSQQEYRKKVIDFMKRFEQALSDLYPNDAQSEQFKEYVRSGLACEKRFSVLIAAIVKKSREGTSIIRITASRNENID
jgi:hypothetical protein